MNDDDVRDAVEELIDFWSPVAERGAGPHPADRPILDASPHRLRLERVPEPWFGNPRTARVFVLTFNPGHHDEPSAARALWDRFCVEMMAGRGSTGEYHEHRTDSAWKWLSQNYGGFAHRQDVYESICNLRLVAYPSGEKGDLGRLRFNQLPSAQRMRHLVQQVLKPRALAGDLALLVMRSPDGWGFGAPSEDSLEGGLFVSRPLRRASVSPTSRVGGVIASFLP